MTAYTLAVLAAALIPSATSMPTIHITIDQCSGPTALRELDSVQTGILHVRGAEQSLSAAYRAWKGYGAVGSTSSVYDKFVRPFTYAWSDIAITYYDADVQRIPDSHLYLTVTNSSERARTAVGSRMRLKTATAWLDFFGITGRSDLLLKATWWILDPLGVFTAAGSEVWSAVVDGTCDSLGLDLGEEALSQWHASMPHPAAAVEEVQGLVSQFMADHTPLGGASSTPNHSSSSSRAHGRVGISAGQYKPHAQLPPYSSAYLGWAWVAESKDREHTPAVGPPVYFTCEVNPLSLRFPAWLAAGIALAHAASNPALASTLLYTTAATMGFTFAVFMVLTFLYRHRTSKVAWVGAAGSAAAALFGHAEGGLSALKSALAGTPLQPLADYWPWMVLLFVLGTTLTSVYFAGQIASSDNPVTWRLLRFVLQAASVACLHQAGNTKAVTLPLILAVHGGGLLLEAISMTCAVLCFLEEVVDLAVQWTVGFLLPVPHLYLVREGAALCGCGGRGPRADRRGQEGVEGGDMEGVVEGGGYEHMSSAAYQPRYSSVHRPAAPAAAPPAAAFVAGGGRGPEEHGYAAAASLRRRRGSMAATAPVVGHPVSGLDDDDDGPSHRGGGPGHTHRQAAALEYIEGVGVCMRTPDGQLYPVQVENLPASPAPSRADGESQSTGRPSLYAQAGAAAPAPGPARTHSQHSNWSGWLPTLSTSTSVQGGAGAHVHSGRSGSSSAGADSSSTTTGARAPYGLPRGLKRRSGSFSAPAAVAAAYADAAGSSYDAPFGHGVDSRGGGGGERLDVEE